MGLADLTYKAARRTVITIVGATVVLIGVVMLVVPGPAIVVIPLGLAILGAEWAWARRLLRTVSERGGDALGRVRPGDWLRRRFRRDKAPEPPREDAQGRTSAERAAGSPDDL